MARGIPIVTTHDNVDYFRELARADYRKHPDDLTRTPTEPVFEVVEEHTSFGSGETRVEAHEIGRHAAHTTEYLVFYFPEQKLMFHGDSIIMPPEGPDKPASARARGVFNAARELRLEVDGYVGAFPLHGAARVVSARRLKTAVAAGG